MHMDVLSRFVTPLLIFLLTLASGLWLSRSGKPLNSAIFTVHKLIALAAVVAFALQTNGALKTVAIQPLLIALLALVALCIVTLFASGALLSLARTPHPVLLPIHQSALVVVAVAGAGALSLLAG
jgi:hypothetical protein